MRAWTIVLFLILPAGAADLEQLGFMTGCWAGSGAGEVWLKPNGGTMLGMSRTVKGDRTVFTEFMHISSTPQGIVLNVQLKLAGESTQFQLTELKSGAATFANPKHDYPQRIIYRRENDGALFARIEGNAGGKARHDDFKYARARCGE